jgi:uncharacterized delta-60 repeat protein
MCWGCFVVLGFDGYDTSDPSTLPGMQSEAGLVDGSLVGDFDLVATPTSVTLVRGGAPATVSVAVRAGKGFSAAVAFATATVAAGVATTADGLVVLPPATSAAFTVSLASAAAAREGSSKLVIRGTAGALSHEVTIDVLVRSAPGAIDPSFGDAGSTTTSFAGDVTLEDMLVQPDDKIVLGGTLTDDAGTHSFAVARHTANGALDTSFGDAGTVTTPMPGGAGGRLGGLVLLPDGKLLAAGTSDAASTLFVARYTASGALDPSFGAAGIKAIAQPLGVVVMLGRRASGRLVIVGSAATPSAVVRLLGLDSNGALDPTFADAGVVDFPKSATPASAALGADGRVVAVGNGGAKGCLTATFSADGTPGPVGGASAVGCQTLGVALDVAGYRGTVGSAMGPLGADPTVTARLALPDGGDDPAFQFEPALGNGAGNAITFDAQGRLVVGVTTVAPPGMGVGRVRRDGNADPTFAGSGIVKVGLGSADSAVTRRIGLQSDGRIVVAGTIFALPGSAATFGMTRLWP